MLKNETALIFQSVTSQDMILMASADTFAVAKTVSDIFSVHDIKNRKIVAEVSTVSPDSPGFGCDECREVVRYRWNNGNLEKEE